MEKILATGVSFDEVHGFDNKRFMYNFLLVILAEKGQQNYILLFIA